VAAFLAMGLRQIAVLRVPQASNFVEGLNGLTRYRFVDSNRAKKSLNNES
jgi:hypothetical protein